MPYATAVILMYGTIDDHYYDDPYLHDPRLLDLVSRVQCIPSPEADEHEKEFNQCDFEVVLKSGARKSVQVQYHRGHWKNPMTDAELEEKFRSLARRYLPAQRIDALLDQLWRLEELPQAGTLVAMTMV
jgi:2-methylcitrate dehydratase